MFATLSVQDVESETLEVEDHCDESSISEVALAVDEVYKGLVVHDDVKRESILEVWCPVHDGVMHAQAFGFCC